MAVPPSAPDRQSALPAFARPDARAPWRPGPELLADSRPARLVRASGMPDLEALQARAVADPAWFWGLAVDDLELAWGRRWDRVLDVDAGIEWPRWWVGGAFDHAAPSSSGGPHDPPTRPSPGRATTARSVASREGS